MLPSVPDEVHRRTEDARGHGDVAECFQRALPERHQSRHGGVGGQTVQLRLVAKRQHRDHRRSADTRRIVDRCLREAISLQLFDAVICNLEHRLLGAELQATRGTCLDTRRLQSYCDAIHAHRALVDAARLLGELRHVERASGHAVPAADALVLLKVDDAVGVLDDGAGRRAGDEATRLGAVHALVFAHQPVEAVLGFVLAEADQVPEVRRHVGHRLVRAHLHRGFWRQIVPLLAGHLAGLAADARRSVDELRHRRLHADTRGWRTGGGANDVEGRRHHTFSSLTRKPLYSGANEFGSTIVGVTRLASAPCCLPRPRKPQWIGKPI